MFCVFEAARRAAWIHFPWSVTLSQSYLCLSLPLAEVSLNHSRGIKKAQTHEETEWEMQRCQLRGVHKILESEKQMDNWYLLE